MAQDHQDPPTAQTIRHERKPAGGSLQAQIDQQKHLIFEMFQRGDSRAAIKRERDRLRFLQRQAEGGRDAVAESAVQEFLTAVERPPTQRHEKGTGRDARRSTAKTLKVTAGQKRAELTQLEAAIEQEKKLIYQMFQQGENRDTIKAHRDRLRQLERQVREMGSALVEAHDRVEILAKRKGPHRFLRALAVSIPFMVLGVLVQSLRFDPFTVVTPWYGFVVVVGLSALLMGVLWHKVHNAAGLGVGYPLGMFVINAVCVTPLGLLGDPNWSLALGFITWLLLGLGLAFTDRD